MGASMIVILEVNTWVQAPSNIGRYQLFRSRKTKSCSESVNFEACDTKEI